MGKDTQTEDDDVFEFEETEGGFSVRLREAAEGDRAARLRGPMSPERVGIPSRHGGKPVVEVAERAFANAVALREAYVPDTVERIGAGAFAGCESLLKVSGMDGVRHIGRMAFEGCRSLETFRLPAGLEGTDGFAFAGCHRLVDVLNLSALSEEIVRAEFGGEPFGLNVHAREDGAGRFFTDADGFRFYDGGGALPVLIGWDGEKRELRLPESCEGRPYLVSGGMLGYGDRTTESVYVPAAAEGFGLKAFLGCWSLRRVEAESLSSWCATDFEDAFANPLRHGTPLYVGGKRIVDLDVPEGTERIGRYAFAGTDFRFVAIPSTVRSFGECAFLGSGVVDELRLGSVASWCASDFVDEYSNPLALAERVLFDGADAKDLRLPEGVEEIGAHAFQGCRYIESVTLPESLKRIGEDAFLGCENLRTVVNLSPLDIKAGDAGHGCVAEHAAEVTKG